MTSPIGEKRLGKSANIIKGMDKMSKERSVFPAKPKTKLILKREKQKYSHRIFLDISLLTIIPRLENCLISQAYSIIVYMI